jgi:hypothetical protein
VIESMSSSSEEEDLDDPKKTPQSAADANNGPSQNNPQGSGEQMTEW